MKIGVTSQNFRTITGHAGKARRFLVFEVDDQGQLHPQQSLDLPKEMSLHEYHGEEHPAFDLDLVITASCGEGFSRRMQAHSVKVVETSASDPMDAVQRYLAGETLPAPKPHEHTHHDKPSVELS